MEINAYVFEITLILQSPPPLHFSGLLAGLKNPAHYLDLKVSFKKEYCHKYTKKGINILNYYLADNIYWLKISYKKF